MQIYYTKAALIRRMKTQVKAFCYTLNLGFNSLARQNIKRETTCSMLEHESVNLLALIARSGYEC